jgi:hypothetical protein
VVAAQLSYAELKHVIKGYGLEFLSESWHDVTYTRCESSMMWNTYRYSRFPSLLFSSHCCVDSMVQHIFTPSVWSLPFWMTDALLGALLLCIPRAYVVPSLSYFLFFRTNLIYEFSRVFCAPHRAVQFTVRKPFVLCQECDNGSNNGNGSGNGNGNGSNNEQGLQDVTEP